MKHAVIIFLGIITTSSITAQTIENNSQPNEQVKKGDSVEDPKFYLDENGVTIKCENCSAGDTGVVNGLNLLVRKHAHGGVEGLDRDLLSHSSSPHSDSLFYHNLAR